MRFLKAGETARSKLGIHCPPSSVVNASNATIPAISNGHSILLELDAKWISRHLPSGSGDIIDLSDATANERFIVRVNNTNDRIEMVLRGGGVWDSTAYIPKPRDWTGIKSITMLLDRTNNRKQIFLNGALQADSAIGAVNPDFSGGNTTITYQSTNTDHHIDLLVRMTVLSSTPGTIADAIKRMWMFPMELDADLQAVAVDAHQYDFEDFDLGTPTVIDDHGVTGGKPLTGNNMSSWLTIGEKP